ncbi:hypothetical protein K438DRAFT_320314 [Mycena galopus ATCC 62051]|nr:hypothetical protein K438DRAFT_320314 [Mycena galopus ATCC 62051]
MVPPVRRQRTLHLHPRALVTLARLPFPSSSFSPPIHPAPVVPIHRRRAAPVIRRAAPRVRVRIRAAPPPPRLRLRLRRRLEQPRIRRRAAAHPGPIAIRRPRGQLRRPPLPPSPRAARVRIRSGGRRAGAGLDRIRPAEHERLAPAPSAPHAWLALAVFGGGAVAGARGGVQRQRGVEREGRVRAGRPCVRATRARLLLRLRLRTRFRRRKGRNRLPPPPLLPLPLSPLLHLLQQRLQHGALGIQHRASLFPATRHGPRNRRTHPFLSLDTPPGLLRGRIPHDGDAERRAGRGVRGAVQVHNASVCGEVCLQEGGGREGRKAGEEDGGDRGGRGGGGGVVLRV